ncbi:Msh2, partial [Symbiodinium microadriaticum]
SSLSDFANFRALVEQTIDLKQAELRNYCISTAFDPSLKQLAKQRDTMREQMEEARADVEKKLGLGGNKAKDGRLSLTECPEGLALRATKKHQQAIQAFTGKPTLKVLSIKKQEVIFTTAELGKLNKQLQQ